MNKKIMVGSLLIVFMLMVLPSIPAVEFNTVLESNRSDLIEKLQAIDINELREKIKTIEIDPSLFNQLFSILYLLACIPLLLFMYFAWWINDMPEFEYRKPC